MLPLIVFSILFGFAVNLVAGPDHVIGKFLDGLTEVMMAVVKLVTYYAPIAFFGFFADLVATYGSQIAADYGRALVVYYPLCFIYIFTAFPLFAWFGGGKARRQGPCSGTSPGPPSRPWAPAPPWPPSPPTCEEAEDTGISKDVSRYGACPWAPPCTWTAPASPAC